MMTYGYGYRVNGQRRATYIPPPPFEETTEEGMIIRDKGGISSQVFPTWEDVLDVQTNVAMAEKYALVA